MKMRKGFTLVELLIVIIIIGILAAAMLMSSGSATDAATASTAISEMRALKAAVIMSIAEVGGVEGKTDAEILQVVSIDGMARYMERPDEIKTKYEIKVTGGVVSIEPKTLTASVLDKVKKNKATGPNGDMG
ncbi:prepilin-type N-terminal cleavage/methylation domain-containing protein, partial [uncultured Fretibacterium sp.]|uniref:prepilin-type N-terminal cleavage/methylation domain-containing protein n=1 Tax=uncultured Fretibacterium sp. TaxID=1678694 RepID=UPI0026112754